MKIRTTIVLGAILALALPAAALAGLPKVTNTSIVPAKSIGGAALGGSLKAAKKAWGKTKCTSEYQCTWEGAASGATESRAAQGTILLEEPAGGGAPKIWRVFISVAEKVSGTKTTPEFNTPLADFTTAKGIGLGSSRSELVRAYPGAKKEPFQGTNDYQYSLKGPKESSTIFGFSPSGRITEITVTSHPGG
jgi:hypothetical protein